MNADVQRTMLAQNQAILAALVIIIGSMPEVADNVKMKYAQTVLAVNDTAIVAVESLEEEEENARS